MHRPIRKSEIPASGLYNNRPLRYRRNDQLRAFLASEDEAWEIYGEGIPTRSAYNSFVSAIRRSPYLSKRVCVLLRGERVFLTRI